MRFSMILTGVLILGLTVTACAPLQTAAQPQSGGLPTAAPSETPFPATSSPTASVIVSTAVASSSGPILVTIPPASGSGASSTPLTPPANGVTLASNGQTYLIHPGDRFLLDLGSDIYDWTINVDDQTVMSRVINIAVIRGAQGIYEVHKTGTATLTADGDPLCLQTTPACSIPSIQFKITVIVQ